VRFRSIFSPERVCPPSGEVAADAKAAGTDAPSGTSLEKIERRLTGDALDCGRLRTAVSMLIKASSSGSALSSELSSRCSESHPGMDPRRPPSLLEAPMERRRGFSVAADILQREGWGCLSGITQLGVKLDWGLLLLSWKLRVYARGGDTGYTIGAIAILVRLPSDDPQVYRCARSVPVDASHLPPGQWMPVSLRSGTRVRQTSGTSLARAG
jgi:hypothetical protein